MTRQSTESIAVSMPCTQLIREKENNFIDDFLKILWRDGGPQCKQTNTGPYKKKEFLVGGICRNETLQFYDFMQRI